MAILLDTYVDFLNERSVWLDKSKPYSTCRIRGCLNKNHHSSKALVCGFNYKFRMPSGRDRHEGIKPTADWNKREKYRMTWDKSSHLMLSRALNNSGVHRLRKIYNNALWDTAAMSHLSTASTLGRGYDVISKPMIYGWLPYWNNPCVMALNKI